MRMNLFSDLLDFIYPRLCVACHNRLVSHEKYLCLKCFNKLPKTNFYKIPDNKLEETFAGRFPFIRIASFAYFVKEGIIQSVIHELKYNNNPELGCFIGELCGQELERSPFIENIDMLVPVPLHPNRFRQRGYNQSLKIAEGISVKTGIRICPDNLIRVIDNTSQTRKSKNERKTDTEGIFDVLQPTLFHGKHILLIDDIITTGSTVEACAKTILRTSQDTNISVYTVGAVVL